MKYFRSEVVARLSEPYLWLRVTTSDPDAAQVFYGWGSDRGLDTMFYGKTLHPGRIREVTWDLTGPAVDLMLCNLAVDPDKTRARHKELQRVLRAGREALSSWE